MATGKPLSPCYLIPDNPIEVIGDADSFQFQPFVDTFVSLAMNKHNGTPFTVVVDGPWGSGKTSLMKMTQARLDAEKEAFPELGNKNTSRPCKTFWFNAWKYSNDDHLLTALLLVMFKGMEEDQNFWDAIKTKIDGKKVFSGLVNQSLGKLAGGDASEYMNELRLAKNAAFLDEFTSLLKTLIRNYCLVKDEKSKEEIEDGAGAFVIFIDDLDRCPPDRVLQVLEAVKLFLDIPGCIFFIGMEVKQVQQAIQIQYEKKQEREGFNAARYLEKIIQIHVKIPPVAEENMKKYLEQLSKNYENHEGFKEKFSDEVKDVFIASDYKTQRPLKRAINDYLFLETLCSNKPDIEFESRGLAKWTVINALDPELTEELADDSFYLAAWEAYCLWNSNKDSAEYMAFEWDSGKILWGELEKWIKFQATNLDTADPKTMGINTESDSSLLEKWDDFYKKWSREKYFDQSKVFAVGKPSFISKDQCEAYKFLNQVIVSREPAEPEKVKSSNQEGLIINGYRIGPGEDLRNVDLRKANLEGVDLRGADLKGANLRRADLRGAKYYNSRILTAKNWRDAIFDKGVLKMLEEFS